MALTPTPVCVQVPKTTVLSFASNYVANTITTLVTGGPNGNKVVAITALNSDSGAHVLVVWENGVAVASFNVPANSGADGATPNGNVMSLWQGLPRDNDGQVYFFIEPSITLGISMTSTLAVGKNVNTFCVHAQF